MEQGARPDISKYLSIPFKHHGRDWHGLDCYGLLMLFYKTEFDIILPDRQDYGSDPKLWDFDYIQDEYKKHYKPIQRSERYCAVTFKTLGNKVANHIGIMLDEASFLHIPANQMVCIGKISTPYWQKTFQKFYKIKDRK